MRRGIKKAADKYSIQRGTCQCGCAGPSPTHSASGTQRLITCCAQNAAQAHAVCLVTCCVLVCHTEGEDNDFESLFAKELKRRGLEEKAAGNASATASQQRPTAAAPLSKPVTHGSCPWLLLDVAEASSSGASSSTSSSNQPPKKDPFQSSGAAAGAKTRARAPPPGQSFEPEDDQRKRSILLVNEGLEVRARQGSAPKHLSNLGHSCTLPFLTRRRSNKLPGLTQATGGASAPLAFASDCTDCSLMPGAAAFVQGLFPRAKELLRLGGSVFLGFLPFMLAFSLLFTGIFAVSFVRSDVHAAPGFLPCVPPSPSAHASQASAGLRWC